MKWKSDVGFSFHPKYLNVSSISRDKFDVSTQRILVVPKAEVIPEREKEHVRGK